MTELPTVQVALSHAMQEVQAVGKTGENKQQNYNFRGVDAVVNAAGPAFRNHGVIVLPTVEEAIYNIGVYGRNKTEMRECTVRVRYQFVGPAGDSLEAVVYAEANDSGDKATAKAMSVAFRTVLLQVLCIPTDEPDPDSVSYERAAPVAMMTDEQLDVIDLSLGMLNDTDKLAVKNWWRTQRLPKKDDLTEADAERVVDHLGAVLAEAARNATTSPTDDGLPAEPEFHDGNEDDR